jgi:hypothetical protein
MSLKDCVNVELGGVLLPSGDQFIRQIEDDVVTLFLLLIFRALSWRILWLFAHFPLSLSFFVLNAARSASLAWFFDPAEGQDSGFTASTLSRAF